MDPWLYALFAGSAYAVLLLFCLLLAKLINDFCTPYSVDQELTEHDNLALSVSFSGYLLAVVIIFICALMGPSKGLLMDLLYTGGYAIGGIILLNVARIINDKLILYKFSNIKEIIEDHNVGTGAVQFGSYIASGLIVGGAIHGAGGGPHTALVFYLLGQVVFILSTFIYNRITPFDLHAEIEKDNVAAGVSFAGWLIAVGIIIMNACAGDFISWKENLVIFAYTTALLLVLLPIMRIIFDRLILSKSKLNQEIQRDKNVGSALLEVSTLIGFAALMFFIMG